MRRRVSGRGRDGHDLSKHWERGQKFGHRHGMRGVGVQEGLGASLGAEVKIIVVKGCCGNFAIMGSY